MKYLSIKCTELFGSVTVILCNSGLLLTPYIVEKHSKFCEQCSELNTGDGCTSLTQSVYKRMREA